MTDFQETPEVIPITNGHTNGVNGDHRPVTPPNKNTGGMSLTEYSANPKTPSSEKRLRIKSVVPDDFLLDDGTPDVSSL